MSRNTPDPGYIVCSQIMIINCLIGTDITDFSFALGHSEWITSVISHNINDTMGNISYIVKYKNNNS